MQVHEVMSRHVVTAAPDERAWSVADELSRLELTGLPVVDADRQVLGLVTQIDLIRALSRGEDLRELNVADVMHPRPLFVQPETEIETAAQLFDDWQIHRLPVCRDGQLVGIVSRGDILRAMLSSALRPR